MECMNCGKKSDRSRLCRACRKEKETAGAIVSQNKSKLKKLLNSHCYDSEWFIKFNLYTNNINNYGKILMKYKQTETIWMWVKIINSCSVIVWFFGLLFAFEVALVSC